MAVEHVLIRKRIPYMNQQEMHGTSVENFLGQCPQFLLQGQALWISDVYASSYDPDLQTNIKYYESFKGAGLKYYPMVLPKCLFNITHDGEMEFCSRRVDLTKLGKDEEDPDYQAKRQDWIQKVRQQLAELHMHDCLTPIHGAE